jgi:hypothetical protein
VYAAVSGETVIIVLASLFALLRVDVLCFYLLRLKKSPQDGILCKNFIIFALGKVFE